jgi:hypothetical protein
MDVFENVQADSDGAWDFEPIFVDSQTLDFRVQHERRQRDPRDKTSAGASLAKLMHCAFSLDFD